MPPNYGDLPLPNEENIKEQPEEIKVSLGDDEIEIDVPIKNSKPTSIELSVLDKIK